MIVRYFFAITKYKSELKVQIVHEYPSTSQSTNNLSKKYQTHEDLK